MNRQLWKVTALLMLPWMLSAWSPIAMSQPYRPGDQTVAPERKYHHHGEFEQKHARMMDQLGLTSEQQVQIKALREQGRNQSLNLQRQLRAKRKNLMDYLKSPQASEESALELQAEINALKGKISAQRIHSWFQMRKILTPEQRNKLEKLHQSYHFNREGNRSRS